MKTNINVDMDEGWWRYVYNYQMYSSLSIAIPKDQLMYSCIYLSLSISIYIYFIYICVCVWFIYLNCWILHNIDRIEVLANSWATRKSYQILILQMSHNVTFMKKWALINGNATTIKTLVFSSQTGWHNIIFSDAWGEWQKNANAEPNKCLG